jgi:hypothetical protein
MKCVLIVLALLSFEVSKVDSQILNGGFEELDSTAFYQQPQYWESGWAVDNSSHTGKYCQRCSYYLVVIQPNYPGDIYIINQTPSRKGFRVLASY